MLNRTVFSYFSVSSYCLAIYAGRIESGAFDASDMGMDEVVDDTFARILSIYTLLAHCLNGDLKLYLDDRAAGSNQMPEVSYR